MVCDIQRNPCCFHALIIMMTVILLNKTQAEKYENFKKMNINKTLTTISHLRGIDAGIIFTPLKCIFSQKSTIILHIIRFYVLNVSDVSFDVMTCVLDRVIKWMGWQPYHIKVILFNVVSELSSGVFPINDNTGYSTNDPYNFRIRLARKYLIFLAYLYPP